MMEFQWIDFEKSGNSYLSLNGYDVAEVYKNDNSYTIYPSKYGLFLLITSCEYTDKETAKKAVEDLIRDFCVTFNIWYMR